MNLSYLVACGLLITLLSVRMGAKPLTQAQQKVGRRTRESLFSNSARWFWCSFTKDEPIRELLIGSAKSYFSWTCELFLHLKFKISRKSRSYFLKGMFKRHQKTSWLLCIVSLFVVICKEKRTPGGRNPTSKIVITTINLIFNIQEPKLNQDKLTESVRKMTITHKL